jgi:hypothetical protein
MNKSNPKEYLAIILMGAGSSYARGHDRQESIDRVAKIAASDWSGLFDLDGKEAIVNVYDVTGRTEIWWEARGVFSKEDKGLGPIGPGEQIKVTLSVPKRRR